jgi:helix-turn-helix protein/GAF domain-containing protein
MRQRREEQGVALTTIAEQTKIKRSLLEALEQDDVRYWPTGFFGRAFIRAYASAIGLNPDVVVREFLEEHPEPVEVVATPATSAPPDGLRSFVGSALGSLGRLRRAPVADDREAAPPGPIATPDPLPMETVRRADVQPTAPKLDFQAVAHLCTELGRVQTTNELESLLRDAATIVGASGLILWVWDKAVEELKPALTLGYPDEVLAQLPTVRRETDNLTAGAFRSGRTCAIDRTEQTKGALAVPLLTPAGCAGVLAVEFRRGGAQPGTVRDAVTIFAAVLALLISGS